MPAVAAGFADAAIGSSSNGVGVALTGGVGKSAGAYAALKVAGTVAAVAVLGTAAVRHQTKSAPPDPVPRHAQAEAHSVDASPGPALRKARAVQPARLATGRRDFVAGADERATVAADRTTDPRPASPGVSHGIASGIAGRPADAVPDGAPGEAASVADPPVSTADEKQSSPSATPEKQPGPPPKPEKKAKSEHPPKPEKQSPGQTKKAAQAEAPAPEAEPPPPAAGAARSGECGTSARG